MSKQNLVRELCQQQRQLGEATFEETWKAEGSSHAPKWFLRILARFGQFQCCAEEVNFNKAAAREACYAKILPRIQAYVGVNKAVLRGDDAQVVSRVPTPLLETLPSSEVDKSLSNKLSKLTSDRLGIFYDKGYNLLDDSSASAADWEKIFCEAFGIRRSLCFFVKPVCGATITVRLSADSSIGDLKQLLSVQQSGLPVHLMRISDKIRTLADDTPLAPYGDGFTFDQSLKLSGGSSSAPSMKPKGNRPKSQKPKQKRSKSAPPKKGGKSAVVREVREEEKRIHQKTVARVNKRTRGLTPHMRRYAAAYMMPEETQAVRWPTAGGTTKLPW